MILMLCSVVEMGKIKCDQYWPESEGTVMKVGDFEVSVQELASRGITKREISITLKEETRKCLHLQYSTWQDFGTPDVEDYPLIEQILSEVESFEKNKGDSKKIIVHCSAGIGRTGSLIAVYNCIQTIQKLMSGNDEDPRISVFSVVRRIRE